MNNQSNQIKIAILAISSVIMAAMTNSAILADIGTHYPNISESVIQMVLTIPSLVGMFFAIASGPASGKIAKKTLVLIGLFFGLAGGMLAFILGGVSIYILLFSSVLIGVNQGINSTMSMALISDYFVGDEASSLMGLQSAFVNLGGMVIIFISGLLAGLQWKYAYIIYLVFIPIIAIVLKNLPNDPPIQKETNTSGETTKKGSLNSTVYFSCIVLFFFAFFMYVFQSNISVYIMQNGLGDASTSGLANTIFSATGAITGFLYGKIKKTLKDNIIPLGVLSAGIGLLLIYTIGTLPTVFIGSILLGYGMSSIMPTVMFINSEAVTPAMSATAIALTNGASNIGMFLSPMLINPLMNLMGKTTVDAKFLMGAIGLFLVAIIAFAGRRKFHVETANNPN